MKKTGNLCMIMVIKERYVMAVIQQNIRWEENKYIEGTFILLFDDEVFLQETAEKGYGFIWGGKELDWSTAEPTNGNGRTLYLQKNYFKFGKSDYSSGLILPAITSLKAATNVELTFDWCWCMTGSSKPDIMTLTVAVSGGTDTELSSEQPTAEDLTKLEWQHASVTINGVTSSTRITLRPTNSDPYKSNTRGQNRWYLDNIKIVTK